MGLSRGQCRLKDLDFIHRSQSCPLSSCPSLGLVMLPLSGQYLGLMSRRMSELVGLCTGPVVQVKPLLPLSRLET